MDQGWWDYQKKIADFENKATDYRRKSEALLEEIQKSDQRKWLNPADDVIPEGKYPKLKDCKTYPLRRSCNYGENVNFKWKRCEYMEFDNSKSINDPNRWICTAPE